tara:strand:+ start:1246 stop:1854 length:609 start_codon:yes stop_codon:yes gene_type:complete
MQEKDMCLRNEKFFCNLIIFFILFSKIAYADSEHKDKVLDYLSSLKFFSASFLQNDGENLSEGKVYIGKKRVRAEYYSPTKILIVLGEDKAMYYNYELQEDEFFNPKNTNAWFFYEIFRNPIFFKDGVVETKKNELIIKKNGVDYDDRIFSTKVYFEKNPLILRAIEFVVEDSFLKLSIYNHNYNEEFDNDFFKLINPKFLD